MVYSNSMFLVEVIVSQNKNIFLVADSSSCYWGRIGGESILDLLLFKFNYPIVDGKIVKKEANGLFIG